MKKVLAIVVVLFVIVGSVNASNQFSLKNYFDGEYYVYTQQKLNNLSTFLGSCYVTKNLTSKDCIGESMVVNNLQPVVAIQQLKGTIIKTEKLKNGPIVIYAYSPQIKTHVNVDGKRANIQIANYEDYSVIGWPMILGSF